MKGFDKKFDLYCFTLVAVILHAWASHGLQPYLTWPGKQIIPLVYALRNDLILDSAVLFSSDSPYIIFAQIIDIFSPKSHINFLIFYVAVSLVLKALVISLSVLLILRSLRIICTDRNIKYYRQIKIYIFLVLTLYFILFNYKDGVFRSISGVMNAGWDYPLHDSFNPSGFSYLLVLIFCLRVNFKPIKSSQKIFLFLGVFLATFVHPIAPIFLLAYFFFMYIFLKNSYFKNHAFLYVNFKISLLAWIVGCFFIRLIFPQSIINVEDLYRIYVEVRHPHHYQPSFYLTFDWLAKVLFNISLLKILSIGLESKSEKKAVNTLIIFLISYLILVNAFQFLFVEMLRVETFIFMGITRLLAFYNFVYILTICYILLCQLFRIYSLNAEFPFIQICKPVEKNITGIINRWRSILLCLVFPGLFCSYLILQAHSLYNSDLLKLKSDISALQLHETHPQQERYLLLVDKPIENLREIGKFSIFSDGYFPFSNSGLLEWDERRVLKRDFLKCAEKFQTLKKCTHILQNYHIVYYLSDKLFDDGDVYFVDYKGVRFFVYRIVSIN